ncbi:D-lactate dehydrogenase [cytochrome] 1, mitochondrial [[Candida] jaroonii]|uniref:D-lactate dehydrogenase [cytochrome] 1, mitochondrial n=1 Tax=[Candida] jaroonii TaxID=467808 RepID=A0ACA9Y0Y1_9ASCO|nr:D-lactate dehydrogenase [cytochrome] 1, mitochondrial [[Candida] jaroonii]
MFRLIRRSFPNKSLSFTSKLRNSRTYSTRSGSKVSGFIGGSVLLTVGVAIGSFYAPNLDNADKSTVPLEDVKPLKYADDKAFAQAVKEIKAIVGDHFSENEDEIKLVSDIYFGTHRPPEPLKNKPGIIVSPKNTEEVSEILKIAHKYRVPIVANSGMTSLEGHTIHTRGPNSISISFTRMNEVLEFHPDDLDAVVQAGVGWQDLDEYLLSREDGKHLSFGPDPGMGATIGGMTSTSASGTNAYKYGTMKENVINITVVLADGTILKTKQRPRKSSAGYDLTHLFIGQEGTLGLITEITVKLNVRPIYEYVTILTFPSVKDATQTASTLVAKSGLHLNAIEILDKTTMSFVNSSGITDGKGKTKKFLENPTLFLKIGGATQESIKEQNKIVESIAKQNNIVKHEVSRSEEDNAVLWSARRQGLWSTIEHGTKVLKDPNDVQIWTTDIAVPLSHLPNIISETNDDLNNNGFENKFALMGHIGDGNCHFLILYNKEDYSKAQVLVDRMVDRALKFEGTCTGEHGVGIGKRKFLTKELGPNSVDLMRKLKFALDPRAILNPDKVIKLEPGDKLDELLEAGSVHETHAPNCCH